LKSDNSTAAALSMRIDNLPNSSNILAMVSGGISATGLMNIHYAQILTFLARYFDRIDRGASASQNRVHNAIEKIESNSSLTLSPDRQINLLW
jgi:hypothetical protein